MRHTDFVIWGLSSLGSVINKIDSHPFKGVAIARLKSKLRSYEALLARRRAFKSKSVCSGNHAPGSHCKLCNKYKFSWSLSVDHACDSRNPLHIKSLQRDLINVITPQRLPASYKIRLTLSQKAINIPQWWIDSAHLNNGGDMISPTSRRNVFCNASKLGWGSI